MKFRKRPEVIEAERWFITKGVCGVEFPILNNEHRPAAGYKNQGLLKHNGVALDYVSPGDWIITNSEGNRFKCDPRTFEKLYEPLEE